jgi:hypothetical protein
VSDKIDVIRAAIAARLAAVPDIGVVHPRERYAAQQTALRALYEWTNPVNGEKALRGWWVEFRSLEKSRRAGRKAATATWEICGLIGFDDADDKDTAGGLARAAAAAIEADPTLGGAVNRLGQPEEGDAGTVFVAAVELAVFAGMICRRARLTFTTEHSE